MAAGIIAVALSSVSIASAQLSASAPDPKLMVLQLGDVAAVPAGNGPVSFTLKKGRYWTNAQEARAEKTTAAKLVATGRIRGYEADYTYTSPSPDTDGYDRTMEIDSITTVYKTAKGAHQAWAAQVALDESLSTFTNMNDVAGPLGNERAFYSFDLGLPVDLEGIDYLEIWRSGAKIGFLGVHKNSKRPYDGLDSNLVIKLARTQQAHIARPGSGS